jgi:hypothetical protein
MFLRKASSAADSFLFVTEQVVKKDAQEYVKICTEHAWKWLVETHDKGKYSFDPKVDMMQQVDLTHHFHKEFCRAFTNPEIMNDTAGIKMRDRILHYFIRYRQKADKPPKDDEALPPSMIFVCWNVARQRLEWPSFKSLMHHNELYNAKEIEALLLHEYGVRDTGDPLNEDELPKPSD